ncbi:MAG: hypothetical protein HRU12_23600, partial [Phaeodactylibacter sp.]|nr:hypothetical protein [Phaeodactylibacter sp.]
PTWTASAPSFDPVVAPSIVVSPETATTYYAEVMVGASCFRIDSVLVLVDSLPAAGLDILPQDTTVCEGEILILQSGIYEPSDFSGMTFQWGPETGQETPDSLYNLVITGVDTLEYFRITQNGVCTDTAFTTVNVNPTPVITLTPSDTAICLGNSVSFQATVGDNVTSFEWTSGTEQLSCSDCLNPTTSILTQSTSFTFEASIGDCPNEVSANITVLQPAPYVLEESPTICEGESIQLIFNTDPNYNYTWTSSDPDFGTIQDPALIVNPTTTTTYFLVAGDGICPDIEDQVQVQVVQDAVISSVNVSPTDLCSNELVTYGLDIENAIDGDLYSWLDPNGNEVATGQSGSFEPTLSGTYTMIYTSIAGCGTLTETFDLTVSPAPAVDLAADITICLGESVQLNGASDGNTTYTWTSTDPLFSDFNNPEPVVSPTETANYTLTASNGVCDDFVGSVTVQVIGNVVLDILPEDFFLCPGSSTNIVAEAVGGSSDETFSWTGSDGSSFTGASVSVMPEDSTVYTLVYESGGGCTTIIDSVLIEVGDGVFPTGAEIIQEVPGATLFEGDSIVLGVNYLSPFDPSELDFTWTVLFNDSTTVIANGPGLDTIQTQILN